MGYKSGQIYNLQDGNVVFSKCVCPIGFWARFKGLQRHEELHENQAWWFDRCNSVHTFGMKFRLDIIHVSSDGMILKIDESVKERRISFQIGSKSVIEVRSGVCALKGLKNGIFLGWSND